MGTTTFPRSRSGYNLDNGSSVDSAQKKCPNCGSSRYRETVSLEECSDCGLRCDYWGGGANEIHAAMMQRNYRREEQEAERRARQYEEE
jgi:hypothetical protein